MTQGKRDDDDDDDDYDDDEDDGDDDGDDDDGDGDHNGTNSEKVDVAISRYICGACGGLIDTLRKTLLDTGVRQ